MTTSPAPGMVRFTGEPAIFYMAICRTCDIAMPFPSDIYRDTWADQHRESHPLSVEYAVDVRPAESTYPAMRRGDVERIVGQQ
jgi:hypothetical protein